MKRADLSALVVLLRGAGATDTQVDVIVDAVGRLAPYRWPGEPA